MLRRSALTPPPSSVRFPAPPLCAFPPSPCPLRRRRLFPLSSRAAGRSITNQPYALDGQPGINSNYTLTEGAGRVVNVEWEPLGKNVSYDNSYKTSSLAGEPKYMAFISQLNVTYAPLMNSAPVCRPFTLRSTD